MPTNSFYENLFLDNKYTALYFKIVSRAKTRLKIDEDRYYENHHIIPKCMKGNNESDNLVLLTYQEHVICHWCLTKMTDNKYYNIKLLHAFSAMSMNKNSNHKRIIPTWLVELSRKKLKHTEETKQKMSVSHKKRWEDPKLREKYSEERKGTGNSFYSKTHSKETKDLISKTIKENWTPERNKRNSEIHSNKKISDSQKEIVSKKLTGIKRSEETKMKLSLAAKKRWEKKKELEVYGN